VIDIKRKLIQLNKLIEAKECELLTQQNRILKFIDTDHKAKSTEAYQKAMRKTELQINDFLVFLVKLKASSKEFKKEADFLYKKANALKPIIGDINHALSADMEKRQQAEAKDLIKIAGFVSSTTVAFVVVSRATFDSASSHAVAEASAGAVASMTIAFHKSLMKSCKTAGLALCAFPREVKESSTLYYVKEVAKDAVRQFVRPLANERSSSISIGF